MSNSESKATVTCAPFGIGLRNIPIAEVKEKANKVGVWMMGQSIRCAVKTMAVTADVLHYTAKSIDKAGDVIDKKGAMVAVKAIANPSYEGVSEVIGKAVNVRMASMVVTMLQEKLSAVERKVAE